MNAPGHGDRRSEPVGPCANRTLRLLARIARARRGNVAIIFAFLAPVLLLLIGGVVDLSLMTSTKTRLQDAADAAALAVSAAVAKNPDISEAQLETAAQNVLTTNFGRSGAQLTGFHVCAQVQQDCTDGNGPMKMNTVSVAAAATAPCLLGRFVPGVCPADGGTSRPVNVLTTTTIGVASTIQINMLLDTSGSMIVGATSSDVGKIAAWTAANWSAVKPLGGSDMPPCAFACHDLGDNTGPADMAMGLTNAHTAGALTRFDVMMSAAQGLVSHVQGEVQSSQLLARNTYLFNISSFDTSLHPNIGGSNLSYDQAACVLNQNGQPPCPSSPQVSPGLDTALNESMASEVSSVGGNGDGTSAASPIKFLILVTDGLESNRDSNWCDTSNPANLGPDPAWVAADTANEPKNRTPSEPDWQPSWPNVCKSSPTAAPIDTSQCAAIKSAGVVLAVLETPYVALDGQSPKVAPYEMTVRHTIYPNGPNSASALSAALSACASPGYYFQAQTSSDIATGFTTLTDKFIQSFAYIQH